MTIPGKILKFLAIFVVLLGFSWITMQLFFPDEYKKYVAPYLSQYIPQKSAVETKIEKEKLTIAFAQDITELEPTSLDPKARNRLLQVYEPLVQTDKFFGIEPALASAYGQIDEKTWKFKIRNGVKFHNGKLLSPDDVLASIKRAQTYKSSQLKDLIGSIDAKIYDKDKIWIIITTSSPDPLILQKLSFVLIMPKEFAEEENPMFIGTGPYKYSNWTKESEMNFTRNDFYWGDRPTAKNLKIKIIPDREERIKALTSHQIDILGDVPPTYIESLNKSKVTIKTMPSFEVTFLLFNMDSPVFSKKNLREAVAMAIDKKRFMLSTVGYTKQVNQFVSSGVFGFNQAIKPIPYDSQKAQKEVSSVSEFEALPVKFVVPTDMAEIGKEIVAMLRQAGFDVTFISKDLADFNSITKDNSIDLYLMGWKSDMGDSIDFVQSVIHTKDEKKSLGMYNITKYSNPDVDKLIESATQEMKADKRLKTLHEIMKIITEDNIIGVPLFETQVIYGVAENVEFEPRADGYILAKNIK